MVRRDNCIHGYAVEPLRGLIQPETGWFDPKGLGQLADRGAFLALEVGKNRSSRWIDERREGSVQPLLIVHHI